MKRKDTQSLDSVIAEWIRENGLEKPLLEHRVVQQWADILGPTIARYSLFEQRFRLIQKLNDAVGGEAIQDIRLLG